MGPTAVRWQMKKKERVMNRTLAIAGALLLVTAAGGEKNNVFSFEVY